MDRDVPSVSYVSNQMRESLDILELKRGKQDGQTMAKSDLNLFGIPCS